MRWWPVVIGVMFVALGPASAQAQLPPMRVFGTVTVNGRAAPAGTTVEALVGEQVCGEGVTRRINDELPLGYVVDVVNFAQRPGCGVDGERVSFRVGGQAAEQTAEFTTGTFLRVDLTVAGAVATPTPGATPTPFATATQPPATATIAPTATAAATVSPTATATATPTSVATATASPTASPAPTATPTPETTATASATATPAASPTATATSTTSTPTPSPTVTSTFTPPTGTPSASAGGESGGVPAAVWVGLVVVIAGGAGAAAYAMRRRAGG